MGVLHTALPENASFTCENVYTTEASKRQSGLGALLAINPPSADEASEREIVDFFDLHGRTITTHGIGIQPNVEFADGVAAMAAKVGLSREYYSRQYKKQHGLAPKAVELAFRANAARTMLRRGETAASAAHDAGFADQSHLTRHFRSFFGITPAAYTRGLKSRS